MLFPFGYFSLLHPYAVKKQIRDFRFCTNSSKQKTRECERMYVSKRDRERERKKERERERAGNKKTIS